MKPAGLLLALALAGCGGAPAQPAATGVPIEVREVGHSSYCKTPGKDARVALLPDAQMVAAWQDARGIVFAGSGAPAPHAIVEMGLRPTGGYGVKVATAAVLRGEHLVLQATFSTPEPGGMQTQALSTPCVLVALPPGKYTTVEVRDAAGVRASGGVWGVAAEPPAAGEVAR